MATNNNNYTIQQSHINLLWGKGYKGQGMKVGIVDTGLQVDHPMYNGKILCGRNFSDDGRGVDNLSSQHYHSTGVTALVCGNYINKNLYGIAPECQVIIAKALNDGGHSTLDAIANAINYCVEQGADVINCSVGCAETNDFLYSAVLNAVNHGIPVVVSSGNDGHNDLDGSIKEISYPGAYDEVICVGAIDVDFNVADFSNSNEFVDVVAPGVNVLTAYLNNQYAYCDGTSYSAPIISGILVLLKQKFIAEFNRVPTEGELFATLIYHARSIKGIPKQCQGWGYIDCSINKIKR